MFEEQKFLSNGIERELLLGEDEQSEKRKIGAAICSGNRPFLPAFPFKKIILVSQHRVSFQDCPPLSSFLFMNYRGRKLGPKRGKRFCFCLQRKIYARKSQKSSSRGRDPKFYENNTRVSILVPMESIVKFRTLYIIVNRNILLDGMARTIFDISRTERSFTI